MGATTVGTSPGRSQSPRAERDYLIVLVAGPDDKVRAAPVEAVEIPVAEVFGDDDEP